MTDVTWLTQEAHDRLVGELAEREGPTRVEITKRIEAAREEGDLKENGGYHAAKEEHSHAHKEEEACADPACTDPTHDHSHKRCINQIVAARPLSQQGRIFAEKRLNTRLTG